MCLIVVPWQVVSCGVCIGGGCPLEGFHNGRLLGGCQFKGSSNRLVVKFADDKMIRILVCHVQWPQNILYLGRRINCIFFVIFDSFVSNTPTICRQINRCSKQHVKVFHLNLHNEAGLKRIAVLCSLKVFSEWSLWFLGVVHPSQILLQTWKLAEARPYRCTAPWIRDRWTLCSEKHPGSFVILALDIQGDGIVCYCFAMWDTNINVRTKWNCQTFRANVFCQSARMCLRCTAQVWFIFT